MSVETTMYTYQPLLAPSSIRLLRISPKTSDERPISCSMEIHKLTKAPEYTALSYSWSRSNDNDAPLSREIFLDGCELQVTENLYLALCRLPFASRTPLLMWIDAVCIQQSNNEERSSQVALMSKIYKKASNLAIWLGESDDCEIDQLAHEALIVAATHLPRPKASVPERPDCRCSTPCPLVKRFDASNWLPNSTSSSQPEFTFDEVMALTAPDLHLCRVRHEDFKEDLFEPERRPNLLISVLKTRLRAITVFFARRYFHRRWIIQELFQSDLRNATVHWGSFEMNLTDFVSSSNSLMVMLGEDSNEEKSFVRGEAAEYKRLLDNATAAIKRTLQVLCLGTITPFFRSRDAKRAFATMQWIYFYQASGCTDARDRLFAFASITGEYPRVTVDYGLNVADTYAEFAREQVRFGHSAFVLELAIRQRKTYRNDGLSSLHLEKIGVEQNSTSACLYDATARSLPSWVPDFRVWLPRPDEKATYDAAMSYQSPKRRKHNANGPEADLLPMRAILGKVHAVKVAHFGRVIDATPVSKLHARLASGTDIILGETEYGDVAIGDIFARVRTSPFDQIEGTSHFAVRPVQDRPNVYKLVGQFCGRYWNDNVFANEPTEEILLC